MPGAVDGSSVFSVVAFCAKGKIVCRSKSPPPSLQIIIHDNVETEILAMIIFIIGKREFGIMNTIKKLNRQLEKAADSFGNITDI